MQAANGTTSNRVVVITGATAGVGRATAHAYARRGWRVALLARDPAALQATRAELEALGAEACTESVDVADAGAVFAAAERIVERWQAIDLWINDAMATIFAPVERITPEEFARVTAVTYLGAVHGTMAALRHMLPRDAGRIVQVGSALSYRAIPLQSAYCGAKFGVRGFTDALRCELLHRRSRVRVTMVQLPAVDTPQFEWARSRLPRRLQPVPPIHAPEVIAEAIVRAGERMPRERWVGVPTLQAIVGQLLAPGWLDRLMVRKAWDGQMTDEPETGHADALFAPVPELHRMQGRFRDRERQSARAFDAAHVRIAIAALAIVLLLAAFVAGALIG
jgi:NAD(P)-dependent dehydrogenase (short-subunit alcohol dehydrogenase family)